LKVSIHQGRVLLQLIVRGSELLHDLDELDVQLEELVHER
jgi:hypothetical protein